MRLAYPPKLPPVAVAAELVNVITLPGSVEAPVECQVLLSTRIAAFHVGRVGSDPEVAVRDETREVAP